MPDDTNNIWVDSTFTDSDTDYKDTNVEYYTAEADNVGSYSMPVVFRIDTTQSYVEDVNVVYTQQSTAVSGSFNVSNYYFSQPTGLSGVVPTLVDMAFSYPTISGTKNISAAYLTGYSAISGTINNRIAIIVGNQYSIADNISTYFWHMPGISGVEDFLVNYTNYTGSTGVSGLPIGAFDSYVDRTHEYRNLFTDWQTSYVNNVVDISFAGWVNFPFTADVYSALQSMDTYIGTESQTISGSVGYNNTEVFSSALTISGTENILDVYCAIVDYSYTDFEVTTRSGGLWPIPTDVYSTIEVEPYLRLNVDLYSLKTSNFSLGIGEYTTASGYISIDVTDDECAVSVSGTYFMVDGTVVSGTYAAITDGYRVSYNPEDDFGSLQGPTVFTIHAENECGDYLEDDFYLTFGYVVEYNNSPGIIDGIDYGFNSKIAVRVTAEDYASCPTSNSLAWEFESKQRFSNDLGASIVGRFSGSVHEDLSAIIYPQSTAYFYGKEFTVVVNAKDFTGNQMEPFILTYKIEDKP